jgi:hypothetical protein
MAQGSEPLHISKLLRLIRPHTVGLSLCGAGAGGFLVAILQQDHSIEHIEDAIHRYKIESCGEDDFHDDSMKMSIHRISINSQGIHTTTQRGAVITPISDYLFSL